MFYRIISIRYNPNVFKKYLQNFNILAISLILSNRKGYIIRNIKKQQEQVSICSNYSAKFYSGLFFRITHSSIEVTDI